jgi:hypothetical protein
MPAAPTTLAELFRSLELTLTVRAAADEDDAWACTLTRPDGAIHEIESVSFFDVDPETGDEWVVEPTPSRVLSVLAGGDTDSEDEGEDGDGTGDEPTGADDEAARAEAEAAARRFLGDEAYETLVRLDAEGLE